MIELFHVPLFPTAGGRLDQPQEALLSYPFMAKDFGEKERGVEASKNFKVGDVIMMDTSVASIIFADQVRAIDYVKNGKEVHDQIST